MQKRSPYKQCPKSAFTLVELVITMVLFLLVAGLVTSFIAFMGGFSDDNEALSARVEESVALRSEIDYWFSYFDNTNFTIEVFPDVYEEEGDGSGARNIATASAADGSGSYHLRLGTFATGEVGQVGRMLECQYPASAQHGDAGDGMRAVRIECTVIERIVFQPYSEAWEPTESEGSGVRFIVEGRVGSWSYACIIVYGSTGEEEPADTGTGGGTAAPAAAPFEFAGGDGYESL